MTNHSKKPSVLNDRQKIVLETIKMRLTDSQALQYMQRHGFTVSHATLTRDKRKLETSKMERMFEIAEMGGIEYQHLERIDNTELALKLMWQNYNAEHNPFRRVLILEKIVAVQPYLSSFYEVTKRVLETNPLLKMKWEAKLNLDLEKKKAEEELELITMSSNRYNKVMSKIEEASNKPSDEEVEKEFGRGVQHIDKSDRQDNNGLPASTEGDRTGEERGGERTATEEGEDHYRKQKGKGIFFNPN